MGGGRQLLSPGKAQTLVLRSSDLYVDYLPPPISLSPFMYQYAFYFHDVKDPELFFQQLMSSLGNVACLTHS